METLRTVQRITGRNIATERKSGKERIFYA